MKLSYRRRLIISSTSKNKELVFHIRFHILHNILITQTNNKRSVIQKLREVTFVI